MISRDRIFSASMSHVMIYTSRSVLVNELKMNCIFDFPSSTHLTALGVSIENDSFLSYRVKSLTANRLEIKQGVI